MQENLLLSFTLFSNTHVIQYLETAPLCSKGFIKIQASSNYEEDNYYQFAYENTQACGTLIIYAILHIFTYYECKHTYKAQRVL